MGRCYIHTMVRLFALLLPFGHSSFAYGEVRQVEIESGVRNIAPEMAYLATESIADDLSEINTPEQLTQFVVDGKRSMNRGFGEGAVWAVLDVKNLSDVNDWYVVLSYPLLDEVDIWVETETGHLTRSERVGDSRPFVSRVIKTPQLVVPVDLNSNQVSRLFFRIKTNGTYYAPIRLHTGESLIQTLADEQTRRGVYFGGLIILALYNLILFLYFRQLQYLLLWGLAMGMVTWFLGETGLVMQYLVSSSPSLCNHLQILSMYSMGTLGLCLNFTFLRDALSDWAMTAHKVFIAIAVLLSIVAQIIPYAFAVRIGLLLVAFYLLASFTFSLRAWIAGYQPARMFFFSMLFAIGGGILIILRDIGVLSVGVLTEQGPSIGVGLFILLLSLSLTDQISLIQRTKDALTESFSKFVPQRLVSQLVDSGQVAHLGGERKDVTLIFSDIRGYSTIAEDLEPEKVIALLTEYFECMQESVEAHGGVILEYVGDGILAAFGVPADLEAHSTRAVECAIDMQNRLDDLNLHWNQRRRLLWN